MPAYSSRPWIAPLSRREPKAPSKLTAKELIGGTYDEHAAPPVSEDWRRRARHDSRHGCFCAVSSDQRRLAHRVEVTGQVHDCRRAARIPPDRASQSASPIRHGAPPNYACVGQHQGDAEQHEDDQHTGQAKCNHGVIVSRYTKRLRNSRR